MILDLEPVFNNEGYSLKFDYMLGCSQASGYITGDAHVYGAVANRAGIVSLSGKADYTVNAPCDRCAVPVQKQVSVPLEHTLLVALSNGDEDTGEYIIVSDMRLNLDEVVTEDVILEFDSKLLCSPECKGLCPICGADLNESQCNCKQPIDPRLEGLLQFLE